MPLKRLLLRLRLKKNSSSEILKKPQEKRLRGKQKKSLSISGTSTMNLKI